MNVYVFSIHPFHAIDRWNGCCWRPTRLFRWNKEILCFYREKGERWAESWTGPDHTWAPPRSSTNSHGVHDSSSSPAVCCGWTWWVSLAVSVSQHSAARMDASDWPWSTSQAQVKNLKLLAIELNLLTPSCLCPLVRGGAVIPHTVMRLPWDAC